MFPKYLCICTYTLFLSLSLQRQTEWRPVVNPRSKRDTPLKGDARHLRFKVFTARKWRLRAGGFKRTRITTRVYTRARGSGGCSNGWCIGDDDAFVPVHFVSQYRREWRKNCPCDSSVNWTATRRFSGFRERSDWWVHRIVWMELCRRIFVFYVGLKCIYASPLLRCRGLDVASYGGLGWVWGEEFCFARICRIINKLLTNPVFLFCR